MLQTVVQEACRLSSCRTACLQDDCKACKAGGQIDSIITRHSLTGGLLFEHYHGNPHSLPSELSKPCSCVCLKERKLLPKTQSQQALLNAFDELQADTAALQKNKNGNLPPIQHAAAFQNPNGDILELGRGDEGSHRLLWGKLSLHPV